MKDPAFLFYPGDWNLGTMHMTLLEKGAYIELLMLQFSRGKFTLAHAKHMLNGSFDLVWTTLKEKFKCEGEFFWNERLEVEKNKRAKFTQSRRNNASKEKTIKKEPKKKAKKKSTSLASEKHMVEHMENENENENENINKDINKIGGVGDDKRSVYTTCMDLYFSFIIQRMGVKPSVDGTQGKHLNHIISYLRTLKDGASDTDVIQFWEYILKHWFKLDTYLSNKLKLSEINSEMVNIINQIKNPKPRLNALKTAADKQQEYAELDRTVEQFLTIKNAK